MDQPNLINMTKKSLDILSQNKNGFFAMIEGASIDKQLHNMDWQRAGYDTIEFDKAIEYANDWSKKRGDDTLIIVVADHAHGISITGTYHERDGKKGTEAVRTSADSIFPTFEDKNGDGFPDNPDPNVTLAVQYANHPTYYENFHFQQKPTAPTLAVTKNRRGSKDRRRKDGVPSDDAKFVRSQPRPHPQRRSETARPGQHPAEHHGRMPCGR